MHSIKDIKRISRTVFNSGRLRYGDLYLRPEITRARKLNHLIIVVHIRRGDVLQSNRVDPHRLVSFGVYVNILKRLVAAHRLDCKDDTRQRQQQQSLLNFSMSLLSVAKAISIFILCESKVSE